MVFSALADGQRLLGREWEAGGGVNVLGFWTALSLAGNTTTFRSATGLSELEEREHKRAGRDRSELDRLPNSSWTALRQRQLCILTSSVDPELHLLTGVVVARSVKRPSAQTRN